MARFTRYFARRSAAAVALGLTGFVLSAPLLFPRQRPEGTAGSGAGLGKVSKAGELQQGLKVTKTASAIALPTMPDHAQVQKTVTGTGGRMEDHLKGAKTAVAVPAGGPVQPPVDPARSAAPPPKSAGPQRRHAVAAAVAVPAGTSYLHLVVRVTDDGKAEVVRATEVAGGLVGHDEPTGHFLYEAARGDKTEVVQAIPDPFEHRSFPAQGGPLAGEGHHVTRAKAAEIVIKVPNASLATAAGLHLRLYKLKPGGRPLEKVDVETLTALKRTKSLDMHFELAPAVLAPQISRVGRKLEVLALPQGLPK
ncbi:MAG: hypothetical protein JWO38_938 [Gemmataceae bacterium]|nr:hypothetical protein [Gemmataceae bacterium]